MKIAKRGIEYLPSDWEVVQIHVEDNDPRALGCSHDTMAEEWFIIPRQLAYFLRVHWSGTDELRVMHRRELANEIKRLLQID